MIPKIPLSKFRTMTVADIQAMGSVEVTADGEFLCVVISPQGEPMIYSYCKEQALQIGFQNNTVMRKKEG